MKENLLRAARSDKSLQNDGIVIANAKNESDSVYAVANQKTFSDFCLEFFIK